MSGSEVRIEFEPAVVRELDTSDWPSFHGVNTLVALTLRGEGGHLSSGEVREVLLVLADLQMEVARLRASDAARDEAVHREQLSRTQLGTSLDGGFEDDE
jgi:hypothetical protein